MSPKRTHSTRSTKRNPSDYVERVEENVRDRSRSPHSGISLSNISSESNFTQLSEMMLKLTENVTSMQQHILSPPRQMIQGDTRGDSLAYFDPNESNMTIESWIEKVEQLREMYNWSEPTTIFNATSKLRGYAQTWYRSLENINNNWEQWKILFRQAFPTSYDHAERLQCMLARKKQVDEPLLKYYYEKLALLNTCKTYGKDAVDCIIAGLTDATIQATAKGGNYQTPETLLVFLKSFAETKQASTSNKFMGQRTSAKRNYMHQRKFKLNDHHLEKTIRCYTCGAKGHTSNVCPKKVRKCDKCLKYHQGGCQKRVAPQAVLSMDAGKQSHKYFMDACIENKNIRSFVDLGSNCLTIRKSDADRLELNYNDHQKIIRGFGNGFTKSVGETSLLKLKLDQAEGKVKILVVPDEIQSIPLIIGQTFTELPHIVIHKDNETLRIYEISQILPNIDSLPSIKIPLWSKEATVIPPNHVGNIVCRTEYIGELFIDNSIRREERKEYCIPRCIIKVKDNGDCFIPVTNLSNNEIVIKPNKIFARGLVCESDENIVLRINQNNVTPLTETDINIGQDLQPNERKRLLTLINKYRNCFATNLQEIGCATSTEININLTSDNPVTYRPYRMPHSERIKVREMIEELLDADIIRESNSPYASPILLVKKKNGEERLCIDYRKLNSITSQDRHPLPRIDDQIDQLRGFRYYTTLDLTSGYYQIPVAEDSKPKTSFVTCDGQYEFNRMPFGLTTAPCVFQRMMNKILGKLHGSIATVYLDDVLSPAQNFEQGLERLELLLKTFEEHNLTLNPKKCNFFQTQINYLGFEISYQGVKPGQDKIKCVAEFPTPKNVHNIRQFLGLTGFFRKFVEKYSIIARPLTELTKNNVKWQWTEKEELAFRKLKDNLTNRPLLAIFNPEADTEVHTDASQYGLAGIILQRQENDNLKPIVYYSRKTTPQEAKYHSYELETLAVVETLKKHRIYLVGTPFKVITDCSAIRTAATKKHIIPRIARWWLLLQEFSFSIEHRPGTKMTHVDALSRNPISGEGLEDDDLCVMRIETADWVLAGQLTDEKIHLIHEILNKEPKTDYERDVHKNYCLEDHRVYKQSKDSKQWVVPKGMRSQVVRAAHDELGHFSLEKTLKKLTETYWFPQMRRYVERHIKSCIPCLYHKKPTGKQEGYLHPIEKSTTPFHTMHIDHLGPFNKSSGGKKYVIVAIESFTKFSMLQATTDTKTGPVLKFLTKLVDLYGVPNRIITDKGTCYTSKNFAKFCETKGITHIQNAVATPRANGQVEKLNSTILNSLATSIESERDWEKKLSTIQFAINNIVSSSTGKTPSELLYGFKPRSPADSLLTMEIQSTKDTVTDILEVREEVAEKIRRNQVKQKERYDRHRKAPRKYKVDDLVIVNKQIAGEGMSKKLMPKYKGPFKIKKVLPNDRYVVTELPGSYRSQRAPYENVEAVDHLKPWVPAGGTSDTSDEELQE